MGSAIWSYKAAVDPNIQSKQHWSSSDMTLEPDAVVSQDLQDFPMRNVPKHGVNIYNWDIYGLDPAKESSNGFFFVLTSSKTKLLF